MSSASACRSASFSRAQLVELGVERRELLLELPVRDLLVELVVAVHVQRRQRNERAARDQPDLLHARTAAAHGGTCSSRRA
ncbi:MAG: hypothetical protein ACLUFI_07775 [Oscillospiraceae bacterium]